MEALSAGSDGSCYRLRFTAPATSTSTSTSTSTNYDYDYDYDYVYDDPDEDGRCDDSRAPAGRGAGKAGTPAPIDRMVGPAVTQAWVTPVSCDANWRRATSGR